MRGCWSASLPRPRDVNSVALRLLGRPHGPKMSGQLLRIHDWESMACQAKFHPAGMAALCSVSLRQMERFFVERFNKTPIAWTRELRCEQARRLIAKGWTNKAVATEL